MGRRDLAVLACLAAAAAACPAAFAEEFQGGDLRWSLSGEARFRPEYRDNLDLDSSADDDMRQGFMRLRLGFTVEIRDDYRVLVQAQDSREAGIEASTASNEKNLDLHQGYLEVRKAGVEGLSLVLGRQEMKYGDERILGAFGWNNVGRSFDGGRARYARDRFWADAFFMRVSSGTAGGATTGSHLYGTYLSFAPRKGSAYEVYGLAFDDSARLPGETADPNRPRTWGDTAAAALGGRIKDRFGRLDLTVEAAAERGRVRGDDLSALAFAAVAGLNLGGSVKVRPFAGYEHATGDEDPADGEKEEFFNFFPTNHPHYGYMDLWGWRNLRGPLAGVSVAGGRHFAQAKVHDFALDEAAGPWKDAAGNLLAADPAGRSGRSVGVEADLTYRFAWREKASLEVGLSRFEPGRFARLNRGDDPSHWGYVQVTVAF
jgi:hypothetical protein